MAEGEHLTGIKKRQQIDGTRKQVFVWVALASAAVVICVIVGINLIQRIKYQTKVNSELGKTANTLKSSANSIDDLIKNVNNLRTNRALTLTNLKSDDSTVFQVVIDALPTEADAVDFSTSLQNEILARSGVVIDSISVDSVSTSSSSSTSSTSSSSRSSTGSSAIAFPTAEQMTFKVRVIGSYNNIKDTLEDIQRTIRPITISSLKLEGTDDKLTAEISAVTYYSPSVNYTTGTKEVPYEEK